MDSATQIYYKTQTFRL